MTRQTADHPSRRIILGAAGAGLALATVPPALAGAQGPAAGAPLYGDDFTQGLAKWHVEMHQPGKVTAQGGILDIDVPAGTSVWFRQRLEGPILIRYQALAVSEGGPNDRVSDLNAFWMATDPGAPDGNALTNPRTGKFEDYDTLKLYYVGQGGNWNKTTRFRRYTGQAGNRPLLPGHDLQDPADMLTPNVWQEITLVADGPTVRYYRDGKKLFDFTDPEPYTSGHFALRTTQSHLRIRRFGIYRPA
ncbi:DUF6250 domain-containing protein [Niveispirillum irakense]|uniref:DUF6250 domain-containing protein n=1 Tax=Niveispirillum irakense TaxID=34011 RepID=UPI000400D93A|nr:DUF6250 domain-containing protein [Niveispirillum irakense]